MENKHQFRYIGKNPLLQIAAINGNAGAREATEAATPAGNSETSPVKHWVERELRFG